MPIFIICLSKDKNEFCLKFLESWNLDWLSDFALALDHVVKQKLLFSEALQQMLSHLAFIDLRFSRWDPILFVQ